MSDYYSPLTEDQARRVANGIGDDFRDTLVRLAAAVGGEDAPLFVDTIPNDSGVADGRPSRP